MKADSISEQLQLIGTVTLGLIRAIQKHPLEIFNTNISTLDFLHIDLPEQNIHLRIAKRVQNASYFISNDGYGSSTLESFQIEIGAVFQQINHNFLNLYTCPNDKFPPIIHAYAKVHNLDIETALYHAHDQLVQLEKNNQQKLYPDLSGTVFEKVKPNGFQPINFHLSPLVKKPFTPMIFLNNFQTINSSYQFQLVEPISELVKQGYPVYDTDEVYAFNDKYGRLCNYARVYKSGHEEFVLPVGHFQSTNGYTMVAPVPFEENSPIYNADKIHQNKDATIIFRDNILEINSNLGNTSIHNVLTSFIGNLEDADLDILIGRNVKFSCREINRKSFEMARVLDKKLRNCANLSFQIEQFVCVDNRQQYSRKEFFEFCSQKDFHLKDEPIIVDTEESIVPFLIPDNEDIEENIPVIENFMCGHTVMVIGGGPKLGKSIFSTTLAYQMSIGETWLGYKLKKSRVCIVDTEMTAHNYKKRGWAKKKSKDFEIFLLRQDQPHPDEERLDTLHRYMRMVKRYVLDNNVDVVVCSASAEIGQLVIFC